MISLDQYLMGREKIYPVNKDQLESAAELLLRVHYFFGLLGIKDFKLSSGYRPGSFNKAAGGSSRSGHLTCEAIDIADPDGKIGLLIMYNLDLLKECELYLEDLSYTEKWTHLQTRPTKNRVFKPY